MKVVILAGGFGTRLSEYTKTIPKPMVRVKNKPLIYYVMKLYARYGFKDFYIALGYKGNVIKNYFKKNSFGWNIRLINTGKNTMTGGRLKRLSSYLNETFLMTYGDGLSNVNLNKLVNFHNKNKKTFTMTAVRPPARFGELFIKNDVVRKFEEKNQVNMGWINGGFFIFEPSIFDYLDDDTTVLEHEPMEKLVNDGELMAYQHHGYWQCMDTIRDRESLQEIWDSGNASWLGKK